MTAPYRTTVITRPEGPAKPGIFMRSAGSPLLMAGLGAATISSSAVLITLSGASAVGSAFYRTALALPLLAGLAVLEQRRLGPRPLAQRLRAAGAGLFLAVDLILWAHAIADVGAGVATVLGNLQVLIVAGIAWLVWNERPARAVAFALPVVILGVVLVSGLVGSPAATSPHPEHPFHPLAGIGFGLGTSVAYAGYLLMLRRSSATSAHIAAPVTEATAGATIGALAFGLVFGGLVLHPIWPSIGWLAALALLSQTAGWLFIASSLPRLPAAVSSLMLLLQPAASLVLADLILHQQPTWVQIVGAVLTCGGALVASLSATRTSGRASVRPKARRDGPAQPQAHEPERAADRERYRDSYHA